MSTRIRISAIISALLLVAGSVTADYLELVRHVNLWDESPVRSSDTSDLTYHPPSGRLIIVDSEISEYGDLKTPDGELVFDGNNVFVASLDLSQRLAAYFAPADSGIETEPVGIAYNPSDGHLYVVDDDRKRIFRYRYDDEDQFGPPIATVETTIDGRYSDPEGITCDPKTGILYVASGSKDERVLKFRFDEATNAFEYLGEFGVSERINDPEGIAIEPASGNIFLVSRDGIAEFGIDGSFVQFFDFSFFNRPDIASTLPGGMTFAPSSDPNDPPDTWSMFVSHRGIDNGKYPRVNTLDGAVSEIRVVREPTITNPLRVPADYPTIQSAIDAASDRDTILVAPGLYNESVRIHGKSIVLVSEHYLTGDMDVIDNTVISGSDSAFVMSIGGDMEQRPVIHGFTLRDGSDGITATVPFDLFHCHITETGDGIDYEGGGGLVRHCRFTQNRDDGIDLDYAVAVRIEQCVISNNGDDGIEIRLQPFSMGPNPYEGDTLHSVIRCNLIEGNGEDGIQFIGYDEETARTFRIEGNFIIDNAMAGVGCMDGHNTREDYSAAPLLESILVRNNTFIGNDYHLSGGANVLGVNNLFVGAETISVKNVVGNSSLTYNLFWDNRADAVGSNIDTERTLYVDPQLRSDARPRRNSPVINAGVADLEWQGRRIRILPAQEYRGPAPDIGAWQR